MTVPGAEPAAEGTSWDRQLVCVAGLGVSGPPAARALAARGAQVIVLDSGDDEARRARAAELGRLGIKVLLGSTADDAGLPPGTQLVVTSPGWRPDAPLLAAAARAGIPVIGDVELAWRLRPVLADGTAQAWLGVTGTNGKTTTVKMLAAMLEAAGLRAAAAGNVGTSAVAAVTEAGPYQVLAVELSSFQLHWSTSLRPLAATVLNLAADHIDWHGDLESYARDKARIFAPGTIAVCNADDPWSRRLAAGAAGLSRIISFRLGPPGPGELGVAAGLLVDRAFGANVALAPVSDVRPAAPHNVANALAAAALARAYGVAGRRRRGRAALVRARTAPDHAGGRGRRRDLRGRLQGHQPARRGRLAGHLPVGGLGGGRDAARRGRRHRRPGPRGGRAAARGGAARPGSRPAAAGSRATRARCPGG